MRQQLTKAERVDIADAADMLRVILLRDELSVHLDAVDRSTLADARETLRGLLLRTLTADSSARRQSHTRKPERVPRERAVSKESA